MPRVTAWKILEGQVMTVTLEHRALTYTGALTLQPPGCDPAARARGWRPPHAPWQRAENNGRTVRGRHLRGWTQAERVHTCARAGASIL